MPCYKRILCNFARRAVKALIYCKAKFPKNKLHHLRENYFQFLYKFNTLLMPFIFQTTNVNEFEELNFTLLLLMVLLVVRLEFHYCGGVFFLRLRIPNSATHWAFWFSSDNVNGNLKNSLKCYYSLCLAELQVLFLSASLLHLFCRGIFWRSPAVPPFICDIIMLIVGSLLKYISLWIIFTCLLFLIYF